MYPLDISTLDAMLSGAIHDKPSQPLTIEQSHVVMQQHIDCRATYCGCKGAALQVLIAEGRIIPDPDRGF